MGVVIKKAKGGKGGSSSSRGASARPIEVPEGMWELISRKAYELWEQRGRKEGTSLRDWLDAEEAVMEEIHETRR
jgi:Protein of unknown function (DUF2934)